MRLGNRKSTNRLDRLFGAKFGERVRKMLKREFVHQEAGGEWPHTFAKLQGDDMDFLSTAENMDR